MTEPMQKRMVRILVTLAALGLLLLAQQGWLDRYGMGYTEVGFKRAMVTFAIARGLNGVISVAQGTEVAVQPAGVGINFTPGQILDPVNDLVERFSWVMLASSTSLGLQKLLLTIFSSPTFTLILALVLLPALLLQWLPRWGGEGLRTLLLRASLVLLLLRFCVPLVALGSEALFNNFLQPQYESASEGISQAQERIGRINSRAESHAGLQQGSLLSQAREWYESTVSSLDLESTLHQYQEAAAELSEQVVNLIVIFVLQTILLPLLMLWIGWRILLRLTTLSLP